MMHTASPTLFEIYDQIRSRSTVNVVKVVLLAYMFTPRWRRSHDLKIYQSQRVLWTSSESDTLGYWFLIHSFTPALKREAHYHLLFFVRGTETSEAILVSLSRRS